MRRRFASAVLWNILASVISRSMVLVAAVFCARILGKTGFGQLGVVQSTANMVGTVAALGLGVTATQICCRPARAGPGAGRAHHRALMDADGSIGPSAGGALLHDCAGSRLIHAACSRAGHADPDRLRDDLPERDAGLSEWRAVRV